MSWYIRAQATNPEAQIPKPCARVRVSLKPGLIRGLPPAEYYYIDQDSKAYYVKDSCDFGDGKHNSWQVPKSQYDMEVL